ncbi:hypothetical protein [Microbulbifer sp.]|uniref:hypothetical protein n=1 Tax=Microbulbifer sp. TaxID=1908541 RepID=UPI0025877EDF|nr:hypothetical protein [Microbulbifer sp.]
MRTLILLFSIFHVSSVAAGIDCRIGDEPDRYRIQISEFGESLLCGFSPEYVAAFRVVVIPSFGDPKIATVYHRHDGTVDLDGNYPINTGDYVQLLSEFKELQIFDLDSYENLIKKNCNFLNGPVAGNDPPNSEPSRCPIGFDGTYVFLEAAYGGKKRAVLRWNGLSEQPYVEKQFSRTANHLLSISGKRS